MTLTKREEEICRKLIEGMLEIDIDQYDITKDDWVLYDEETLKIIEREVEDE